MVKAVEVEEETSELLTAACIIADAIAELANTYRASAALMAASAAAKDLTAPLPLAETYLEWLENQADEPIEPESPEG